MHICLIAIKVKAENIWQTIPVVKGDRGESAYEIAVRDGFEGTEEEWLESLSHGPKGNDGAPGNSYQFIFKQTDISQAPVTPDSSTSAVPEGWTASPSGVNAIATYEWVSVRLKTNEVWSVFSTPALWAVYGFGDNLPDIYIEDVIGLQEALNDLTSQLENKISTDLLPEPNTLKLPGADAFGVVLPKFIPIATPTSLGGIKLGGTFSINNEGLANVNLRMSELKEALDETPEDGAVIVWDETLGKYKNTLLSITGLFHPLYGKDNLNLRADILRSKTLIIPKTPATPDANEVALHAIENGYSITDPEAFTGAQYLDDLNDVALAPLTLTDGDSLFKDGLNFVNKPAYTKDQITTLFNGLSRVYHPLNGRDYLDFIARDLRSRTLFIPTEDSSTGQVGVSIFAQENGYSIANPGEAITEFGELHDILALAWLNGQALLYRDGIFGNETIYNKLEVDALLTALNLGNYYTKQQALQAFHPKFGISGGVPLDLTADRLKSNTLLVPKTPPVLENTEIAIHAQENGYSLMDPEEFIKNFYQLDDISNLTWLNGQALIFRNGVFSNEPAYNKSEIDGLLTGLDMTTYLKKIDAANSYHPKFGFLNGTALDFTANRLKSSTLIIPKNAPILENSEVGLHALENGYSIAEPSAPGVTSLSTLEDVSLTTPLANNEILAYSLASQRWINLLLSFNMFSDELSANSILVNDNRKFVSNAQIADWNSRWIYDEDTIKAIKVNAAIDSDKLGGIVAEDYWHVNNSNLYTVDWKAKVLRSRTLVVPKEVPIDLAINEVAIHALENGYSIVEPGGGSNIAVLNDLDDVTILNPTNNHSLFFDQTLGVFFNALSTFDKINGTLDPARILTNAANRFVSDMQIIDWNSRESTLNKNVAGGYLGLNASAKIDFQFFPDIILGQVKYGGTFNINGIISSPYVALNGENINAISAITYTGYYFISQADVTVVGIPTQTGDWIISNGAAGWAKVDNTDAVTSVNGRIGPITLTKSDVGLGNVDNIADSLKNVLSATKLFTARTLWGQSFDGTSNITGSLTDVANITGSGILNMGAILIPKTLYPTIPNNTVAIHAVENGYSIYNPEAGSVGSLDDLSDVDLIARVDKQLLHYNNVTGKFTNGIIDFSYISGNLGADKITQSDSYRFVTATEKSRFQTAYDWGNHAIAGYLTTSVAASTYAAKSTTLSGYGITDTPWTSYLPLSGGEITLNGVITKRAAIGSGWARSIVNFANSNDTIIAGLSAMGESNSVSYLYLGFNGYGDATNLRIYPTYASWGTNPLLHSGNFSSYADSVGAAATVQGNLNTHINNNGTSVHGLGSASLKSDTYFALLAGSPSQPFSASTLSIGNAMRTWTAFDTAKLQVGSFSMATLATSEAYLFSNTYHNGSYKRVASGYASRIDLADGINFQVAGTGAADSAITYIQALGLTSTGAATFASTINGLTLGLDATYGSPYYTYSFGSSKANGVNRIFATTDSSDGLYLAAATGRGIQFRPNGGISYALVLSPDLSATFASTVAATSFIENGTALGSKYLALSGGNLSGVLTINKYLRVNSEPDGYGVNTGYVYFGSGAIDRWIGYDGSNFQLQNGSGPKNIYHTGNLTNTLSSSYLPYWNGSSLVNSALFQNGTKIGIGVITPLYTLSVSDGTVNGYFNPNGTATKLFIGTYSNHSISFAPNDVERVTITTSGSLGIGYSSGTEITNNKFAVNGSGYFNQHLSIRSAHDGLSQVFIDSNYGTSNNAALRILYNGGVSSLGEVAMLANRNSQWSLIYGNTIGSSLNWGIYIEGNKTNYFGGQVWSAHSIKIGSSWEAIPNGTSLDLNYGGVLKARLDSSGNITAVGGMTCFAT